MISSLGLGNLQEGGGGDGINRDSLYDPGQKLEKLRQFWDPKALGQCTKGFWSLNPV